MQACACAVVCRVSRAPSPPQASLASQRDGCRGPRGTAPHIPPCTRGLVQDTSRLAAWHGPHTQPYQADSGRAAVAPEGSASRRLSLLAQSDHPQRKPLHGKEWSWATAGRNPDSSRGTPVPLRDELHPIPACPAQREAGDETRSFGRNLHTHGQAGASSLGAGEVPGDGAQACLFRLCAEPGSAVRCTIHWVGTGLAKRSQTHLSMSPL